jgi:SAM-dependent methyltransferase
MPERDAEGRAVRADYDRIGVGYANYRQPDPRIAAVIDRAFGEAQTVLNVGAGAGSYEPLDRQVTAVEPSATMRAQRPAHLVRAIEATAENLPFPDRHFDAAMASFTVHHWPDLAAGLREVRRVTQGPVLVLTCDPAQVQTYWLNNYAPDVLATEARRFPPIDRIAAALGGKAEIIPIPIPLDCHDGFNEAYYGRPEMFLAEKARLANSSWAFINPATTADYVAHLRQDLASGAWDGKYGKLRTQPEFAGSLRLVVGKS